MRSLISGLQQYGWLNENHISIQTVDINALLLHVKHRLEKEFPSVMLITEVSELPQLEADKEQIELLLYHLLFNAIRFRKAPKKAHVKVWGAIAQRNKFQNVPGKYIYADFLKLDVKDDGIGFDSKYVEQAFELFKRLHAESGLGIGLSLCKKITENHHGFISIDTEENKGTTVTIWLPLKQG